MTKTSHSPPELQAFLDAVPDLYLILSPDLKVITASKPYIAVSHYSLDEMKGRHLFDLFPDNPELLHTDGSTNLQNSLAWVLLHKKQHQMPLQRYDVQEPRDSGHFREKYWLTTNTPMLDEAGNVQYILHKVVDVSTQMLTEEKLQQSEHRLEELSGEQEVTRAQLVTARAEANLERQKLYNTFMQAPAMICLFEGPRHVFKFVNPLYQQLVGKRPIIGKPLLEAMPELKGQGILDMLDKVFLTGEGVYAEEMKVQLDHSNSGELGANYYNFTYQPIRDLQGNIEGIMVFAYQVTAQVEARLRLLQANKELHDAQEALQKLNLELEVRIAERTRELEHSMAVSEQSAEQLRLITDALPVLIGYLDKEEKYRFANKAYEKWFPLKASDLLGRPVREVVGETAYNGVKSYIDRALAGERLDFESKMPYRQDFVKYIRTSYVPDVKEGEVAGFYTLVSDITDQVVAFQKLEESEQEAKALSKELAATNLELSQANEQLVRTNIDLDNFIYTASHDLKAPIFNIERLVQILIESMPPALLSSEELGKVVTMIEGSINRFKRTIDHLTEVVKLQKENNPEATVVDLSEMINDVRLDLASQMNLAGVMLEIDVAACTSLHFSHKNLRSIIYNLLSNAIKYSANDRKPMIRIACVEQEEYFVLTVQDNGMGMNLSGQSKLFTMFSRMHSHVEGSGIGLYMVKKIVENAGGHIEVESKVDVGSTFRVYLKK
jgi:two-component system, sensor histidine kinase